MARIYDPGRAEIYQRLGIPTVATVKWNATRCCGGCSPRGTSPSSPTRPARSSSPRCRCLPAGSGGGWQTSRRPPADGSTYLTRLGDGMIPGPDTVYQEGDLIHIALKREDLAIAERVLDAPPPAH